MCLLEGRPWTFCILSDIVRGLDSPHLRHLPSSGWYQAQPFSFSGHHIRLIAALRRQPGGPSAPSFAASLLSSSKNRSAEDDLQQVGTAGRSAAYGNQVSTTDNIWVLFRGLF